MATRFESVALRDRKQSSRNTLTRDDRQIRRLVQSIQFFGFPGPGLVHEESSVIAGSGRRATPERLGRENLPTLRRSQLSELEKNGETPQ
ncbi:hypothetical protein ACQ5SP_11760 [Rhodovulum sp. YNF3179]|uniref:hypothetical protein n=1 Tax=Rhodovulum sp. YNF3179 TaxID=3425127 RepID=UPI003D338E31